MPYLSASAVVIHYEEALYQVYGPLPLPSSLSSTDWLTDLNLIWLDLIDWWWFTRIWGWQMRMRYTCIFTDVAVGCTSLLAVLMAVETVLKVSKGTTSELSPSPSCRDCQTWTRCSSPDTSSARCSSSLCSRWWINFMRWLDSAQSLSFCSQVS